MPYRLAYKDRWFGIDPQPLDTGECVPEQHPLDSVNDILLTLSAVQWTKLYSSIMVGSYLMYEDEAIQIQWDWLQGVACMQLCAKILECFNDPEWLADFIQALNDNGIGSGGSASPSGNSVGVDLYGDLFAGLDCDDDLLVFGKALEAVAMLDRMATDAVEIIEVVLNPIELLAEWTDNVPVLGQVFAFATESLAWVQDSIAEVYVAAYTASVQEEIACRIYCELKNECAMDIHGLIDAYSKIFVEQLPNLNNLGETLDWIYQLAVDQDLYIVAAFHLLILNIIDYGSRWFGATGYSLRNAIAQAGDAVSVPSCDCGWCWEIDLSLMFRPIPEGCEAGQLFGVFNSPVWNDTTGTCDTFRVQGLSVRRSFGVGAITIDEVEIHYTSIQSPNTTGGDYPMRILNVNGAIDKVFDAEHYGTDKVIIWREKWVGNHIIIEQWPGVRTIAEGGDPTGGDAILTKLILRGYSGSNPFGTDNCT